jgi:coenzyme F420-dependent glucose-6-phosphate dehydrogenase
MTSKKLDAEFEVALDLGENDKDPADFRDAVVLADKLGFDFAWLGDHFMPWTHGGNRSSFVWSVIASGLEASKKIKVGPYVTTPIGARYHPAIIAQASATLDNMYPGRFALGVGTGEAINELPFLEEWPAWKERMSRMIEGMDLMRKLWYSASYFDFEGKYFRAKQIFLYTKPKSRSLDIYFSSVGPKSAKLAGEHGDGLITLSSRNSIEKLRDVVLPSFLEGAQKAGKDPSAMKKIVSLSFTMEKDKENYLRRRKLSAGNLAKGALDEPDPRRIQEMGLQLSDEELIKSTNFCSSWDDVLELISRYKEIGFSQIVLECGPDAELIRKYAEKLLPYLK